MNLMLLGCLRSKFCRIAILGNFLIGFSMVLFSGVGNSLECQDYWMRHHIGKMNAPICVQIEDMNSDGLMDVIVASAFENAVRWFENPSWMSHLIGGIYNPLYLKVADLDKDGDPDVVVSTIGSKAVVWYENSPGGWVEHIIDDSLLSGSYYGVECLDLIDLSGDDTLDVVAAGPQIVWFEWPNWTPHIIDPEPGGPLGGCSSFCIDDVNGDSVLDLVSGNWSDSTSVVYGNLIWYDSMKTKQPAIATDLGVCYGIDVGDIDHDGDPDVAASSWGNNWVRWYDKQNGNWSPHNIASYLQNAVGAILIDSNENDSLDIIVGGNFNPGWVGLYENQGVTWQDTLFGQLAGARSLALGDINGDPYYDVVVCGFGADSIVWYDTQIPIITSIFDNSEIIITEPVLHQNYPNPFNPKTVISWQLPVSSPVKIMVYNITGQAVATLIDERQPAGVHSVEWDGSNLASGVYLYRLKAGGFLQTRKMVVMK